MSAEKFSLPVDKAYEDGTRLGELVLADYENEALVFQDIDWEQEVDPDGAVQWATGMLATESHYANMAHLMLCGEIIRFGVASDTLDAQRIAVKLAAYKMEDANIWGRYLGRTGAGFSISSALRRYYAELFDEHNVLPIFIGMETLGCPFSIALFNAMQDVGDALYQDIADNMVAQKQDEKAFVSQALEPVISDLSHTHRAAVQDTVTTYRDRATTLLSSHDARLEALNIDSEALADTVRTDIDAFHDDLGLTA